MRDFIPFQFLINEAEKKRQSAELKAMLDAQCAPAIDVETKKIVYTERYTYITTETMKARGMRKACKHPFGDRGEKKAPVDVTQIGQSA